MEMNKTSRLTTVGAFCALAFSVALSAVPLNTNRTPKQSILADTRIATFEFGPETKSPCLRVFNPLEYTYKEVSYKSDISQLNPLKKTTVNVFSRTVAEEYFDESVQRGAFWALVPVTRTPETDPLVEVYQKGIPLLINLKGEKDAEKFFIAFKASLEKAGVYRTAVLPNEKPYLVLIIDGKDNVRLNALEENIIDEYFTRTTFDDSEIKKFFQENHNKMLDRMLSVDSEKVSYVTDGYLGATARTINSAFKGFSGQKIATLCIGFILTDVMFPTVFVPIKAFFGYHTEPMQTAFKTRLGVPKPDTSNPAKS